MLHVKTPEEVLELIDHSFVPISQTETLFYLNAVGRILAEDICASEYVPDFDRSTVDGYAVNARDTFGCSDSIPALLEQVGQVLMGESPSFALCPDTCAEVPTGGAIPEGADACVMVEYTENYGDGTIGILKPAAPGENLIFRGDDVVPGQMVLSSGSRITPQAIGSLSAMGISSVTVCRQPKVGIISTGDELVPVSETPGPGQIRDINSALLSACITEAGGIPVCYGIVKDEIHSLRSTLSSAVSECDMVLISGGSSVGAKDATCKVIAEQGRLLLHGIAMKPGKPTILGSVRERPVFGLPGHPAAAFFVTKLFVLPTLYRLCGRRATEHSVSATLTESISANHGRAQYISVTLEKREDGCYAKPVRSKSGLISTLSSTDGYICIPRDCEGFSAGTAVSVILY